MAIVRCLIVVVVGISNTLLACTGAAGGQIVCFGFDGHIGIESVQTQEACCDRETTPHEGHESGIFTGEGCACIDIPIPHGGRTMAGRPMTAPKHELHAAINAPMAADIRLTESLSYSIAGNHIPPPVSASHAALGAIVLLV